MRADLAEVGKALKQRGYPWGMVTNGLALTEKRFKELMASGLRSMAISFDGMQDNHNWLRQHPLAFEGATRAIKLAAEYSQSPISNTQYPITDKLSTFPHKRLHISQKSSSFAPQISK